MTLRPVQRMPWAAGRVALRRPSVLLIGVTATAVGVGIAVRFPGWPQALALLWLAWVVRPLCAARMAQLDRREPPPVTVEPPPEATARPRGATDFKRLQRTVWILAGVTVCFCAGMLVLFVAGAREPGSRAEDFLLGAGALALTVFMTAIGIVRPFRFLRDARPVAERIATGTAPRHQARIAGFEGGRPVFENPADPALPRLTIAWEVAPRGAAAGEGVTIDGEWAAGAVVMASWGSRRKPAWIRLSTP